MTAVAKQYERGGQITKDQSKLHQGENLYKPLMTLH